MDWQQLATLLIVAATVGAFWRAKSRSSRSPQGCVATCGCAGLGSNRPQRMIFRSRRGQRAEVIVKAE